MLAYSSLAALEYTVRLKAAVFATLDSSGLWAQCVATDAVTNLRMQPAALRATTDVLTALLAPVFCIDAPDAVAFMAVFVRVFEGVLRKQFGARTAASITCPVDTRVQAYEVTVCATVVATFQYGIALPPGATEQFVKLGNAGSARARLLPYAAWRQCTFYDAGNPVISRAVAEAAKPVIVLAAPLTVDTHVAEVRVAPPKSKPSKEVVRLNACIAKLKEAQAKQEDLIAQLQRQVSQLTTAAADIASMAAKNCGKVASLDVATFSMASISATLDPVAGLSSAPLDGDASIAPDPRVRVIQRAVQTLQRHVRAEPKAKAKDSKPVIPGGPSMVCLLNHLTEQGSAHLAATHDMFHRFATIVASVEDVNQLFNGDAPAARPKGLPALRRVQQHPEDKVFHRSFVMLLQQEGDDSLSAPVMAMVSATRRQMQSVLGTMTELKEELRYMEETQADTLRFTYYSAMTTGIAMFCQWLESEELAEKAVQFHLVRAKEINKDAAAFAAGTHFCINAVIEATERQGVAVLKDSFSHILPAAVGGPQYCFAMATISDAVRPLLTFTMELLNLINWIEEVVCDKSGIAPTSFTGISGNSIPVAFRAVLQSIMRK